MLARSCLCESRARGVVEGWCRYGRGLDGSWQPPKVQYDADPRGGYASKVLNVSLQATDALLHTC